MGLDALTSPDLIFPELPGSDRPTVLRAFSDRLAEAGLIASADDLYRKLWEREELGSTAIGAGVAIPHCKLSGLDRVILAVGLCPKGVDFDAADEAPVKLFFLVVSPKDAPAEHLQSLAAVSKWVKGDRHVEMILKLKDADSIYRILSRDDD